MPNPYVHGAEHQYMEEVFSTDYSEDEYDQEIGSMLSAQYYRAMAVEPNTSEKKHIQFTSGPGKQPEIAKRPAQVKVELPPIGTGMKILHCKDRDPSKDTPPPAPLQFIIQDRPPKARAIPEFVKPPNSTPINTNCLRTVSNERTQENKDSPQGSTTRPATSNFENVPGPPRVPMEYPERRTSRPPAKGKFTTVLCKRYTESSIYVALLESKVSLTVGELLAMSLALTKKINEETCLKNSSNQTETCSVPQVLLVQQAQIGNSVLGPMTPSVKPYQRETYDDKIDDYAQEFPDLSTYSTPQKKPLVFSPAGVFVVNIVGYGNVLAMLDTGAEISLIKDTLANKIRKRFPGNLMGKSTNVKNVLGSATLMQGHFNNLLLGIGGQIHEERLSIADDWHSTQLGLNHPINREST